MKEDAPDPLGGRFVRDGSGKLTGLVLEYANFRLARRLSELTTDEEALRQTREFLNTAARFGITSVQGMSGAPVAPDRSVVLFGRAPTLIRVRPDTVSTHRPEWPDFSRRAGTAIAPIAPPDH